MILQTSFLNKKPTQTYIAVIFFIFLATTVLSVDPKFEACRPRSCGNGPIIKYPFWIPSQQESFCGYPGFDISCSQNNPILNISNTKFLVKDISYTNSYFLVANMTVYDEKCPAPMHNYSLDQTPFSYSSDTTHISFFYNCTTEPPDYPTYDVDCARNATLYSFAVFHEENSKNYSFKECHFMVNEPVTVNAVVNFTTLLRMNYTEILKMGFLLNWTAPDCAHCEKSGGRCGFDDYNKFVCFCSDKPHLKTCDDVTSSANYSPKIVIGVTGAAVSALLVSIGICCCRCKPSILQRPYWNMKSNDNDIEAFIRNHGALAQRRYKFSDVRKMTNFFKVKLGQGGFGAVYKGKLVTGPPVTVKILNASKGNGEEFINEVASISKTSHVNVVALVGFCFEGLKKARIYEFMANGSLEKFIYNKTDNGTSLSWENLHQIAVGIARGLEYLHRGCSTRIFHFDIKPHNILLDENFCPKISDFGLAKLCLTRESIISMSDARSTLGYIAPEVWNRNFGGVSHTSDVYSYGMMLLEMVGGRKNINAEASQTSEIHFPDWIYKKLELGLGLDGAMTSQENNIAKRMTLVGLWCIQTIPSHRPTMSRVIEMLEGSLDSLVMPPKPVLSSPTRSTCDSSAT